MNKKALGLAGLGAVALVGGTLAYYSHEASLDNPFTTGSYETHFDEQYTPPTEDLEPGAKWDKIVGAENTGDYPVLVRVKMNEVWTRKTLDKYNNVDESIKEAYKKFDSTTSAFIDGEYNAEENTFIANQPGDTLLESDGLTKDDFTTVYKHLVNTTTDSKEKQKWFYNAADGYWYWTEVLEPSGKTQNLMDFLMLATNLDTGKYDTKEYYQIAAKGTDKENLGDEWIEVDMKSVDDLNDDGIVDVIDLAKKLKEKGDLKDNETLYRKSDSKLDVEKPGYADSNYTLNITADFVQANSEAVEAAWGIQDITTMLTGIEEKNGDTTLVNVKDTTTDTPDPTEPTDPIQ